MDVTTLVGSTKGHQDGQDTVVQFYNPGGVMHCPNGSTFVAKRNCNCIQAVSAGGAVTYHFWAAVPNSIYGIFPESPTVSCEASFCLLLPVYALRCTFDQH
jgi:hypothetical protein